MRQMNFEAKLDEISNKPQNQITQKDAREMQEMEVGSSTSLVSLKVVDSYQGRAFNRPPGAGSISAQVRSIADRNEALGLLPVSADMPVYVTKEDAGEAQHEEAMIYGGQNPRGGMAAQMQVSELRGRMYSSALPR
ncbi:hypothetical protein BJY01DRAFT_215889 [Aspergillus pseudoustus]|uniref:SMP domain-containing protein n=1 Tax=Aspergillus pseudoustus TaxID=1810923 RepID=A0ABR4JTF7_9EURO